MKNEHLLKIAIVSVVTLTHIGVFYLLMQASTPPKPADVQNMTFVDLSAPSSSDSSSSDSSSTANNDISASKQSTPPHPPERHHAAPLPKPKISQPKKVEHSHPITHTPQIETVQKNTATPDFHHEENKPIAPQPKSIKIPKFTDTPQQPQKTEINNTLPTPQPEQTKPQILKKEEKESSETTLSKSSLSQDSTMGSHSKSNNNNLAKSNTNQNKAVGNGNNNDNNEGKLNNGSGKNSKDINESKPPQHHNNNVIENGGRLVKSTPPYPSDAQENNEEGVVEVEILIAADGHIISTKLHRSSGSGSLDRASIKAARSSTYTPKKRNGEAMTTKFIAVYVFSL